MKLSDPKASYLEHKYQIDSAIQKVLDSGSYILGDEVRKFESNFSKYIGVQHAVGVASGTDALWLGMKALGIGSGDEVITVSHTAVATVSAIIMTGAMPVLVDIEQRGFNIDPKNIGKAISHKTKAILPVHLYGKPCNMDEIKLIAKKNRLHVIEDCAQSTGAEINQEKVGSIGTIGCFSFYPTKNLGCFGDGGAITTNSKKLYEKLLLLRQYGWKKRYVSEIHGYNSRLDEIQAAILNVKLKYLDIDNNRRRDIAKSYGTCDEDSVHHLYVIKCRNRESKIKYLKDRGIKTAIHYPVPIHKQPAYRDLVRVSGSMKYTELASKQVLSLPMYPQVEL